MTLAMTDRPLAHRRTIQIGPATIEVLVSGALSGGTLDVLMFSAPPNMPGPKPHIHSGAEETFHVLAGEMEFTVGDRNVVARAGDAVHVPRGTPHAFRYLGESSVRFMAILSPAQRMDEYFERLADIVREARLPLDESVRAKVELLMAEFGQIAAS